VRGLLAQSCQPHRSAATEGCGAGVLDVWAALRALDIAIDRDNDDAPDTPGAPERD
jgi:hypothetical protein